MDEPKPADRAFPLVLSNEDNVPGTTIAEGLTKRELFAMAAMQGLLSNLAAIRREGFFDNQIEEFAVMRADALLRELSK